MIDMSSTALTLTTPSDRELVITRVFDAPRQLVFDAFTKPEHLRQWWGLRSHTLIVCDIDLRVGGAWRFVSRAPDGSEHGFSGVYREIDAPDRLVQTEGYEAMPGHDYIVTLTLTEQDGKTHMQGHLLYQTPEDRDGHLHAGMEAGMRESYDRLTELLAREMAKTGGDLRITRVFDAPRELVWQAWTDPEHLARWWGPKDFTAPTVKIDLRVGGKYLYCMRSPEGQDFWSTGVYEEIVPFERLVCTDSFADADGNVVSASYYGMGDDIPLEMRVTILLEDIGGKTRMTVVHTGMPGGDMAEMTHAGWNESFDKLAATFNGAR